MAKRSYDPNKLYSVREIAQHLNNCVVATLNHETGPIPRERLDRLFAYTQALVAAPIEHVEEGYLRFEELVEILVAAAFFIHLQYVMAGEKVPFKPTVVLADLSEKSE